MDSSQTSIQLKPIYSHSHMSLYNAPVLSATMSNITLTSGLSIASNATSNGTPTGQPEINNNNNNNIDNNFNIALANNIQVVNSAQLVPITANNVCLNDLQIQQIQQQMHHQSFAQNQFDAARNSNCHQQQQHLSGGQQSHQIQITAPTLSSGASTVASSEVLSTSSTNGLDSMQKIDVTRPNTIADTMSNLSNESSTSTFSDTINPGELTNSSSSGTTKNPLNKKGTDITGTNYVDLAKASCSSNGIISMKIGSSDSSSSTSYRSSIGKGFKCQVCNRDFTQKGNLKTHLMTHSGERPYECQTCGKNFTQKGNLDTHVKIHTETKDHKCQYCDRGFTQRGNLKTHIRSIHTKEKPFACGHCGKAFSQKGNMLTHFRTHDKEARFPCNICGKTFSQKGNLKTHQQRHGRSSGR